MADPIDNPPLRDPAPKTVVSPKVIGASVAAFLLPTAIILVDYLLGDGSGIFAGWNPLAQIAVMSILTSLGAFLSGYVKRDPIRETGARRALVE